MLYYEVYDSKVSQCCFFEVISRGQAFGLQVLGFVAASGFQASITSTRAFKRIEVLGFMVWLAEIINFLCDNLVYVLRGKGFRV